jgi:hypothetical protein
MFGHGYFGKGYYGTGYFGWLAGVADIVTAALGRYRAGRWTRR